MSRLISRDPFAREELHRKKVEVNSTTCSWCGARRATLKGRKYLYQYIIESDAGRRSKVYGLFCSIDCMRCFHGA